MRRQAGRARPHRRHQEPAARSRRLPADVRAGRPPHLREDLQRGPHQGSRREPGQGPHLRPGRARRHQVQPGPAVRARPGVVEGPARAFRPAGVLQDHGLARRQRHVRRQRRRTARRAARPFLPRHRRHRLRGLRPHRVRRGRVRQPAACDPGRIGRAADSGDDDPDRRGRRGADPRSAHPARLLAQRPRDQGGHRRRRVPAHGRHRRARRRWLPVDHRSQEGAHRHRRRQERRPGRARGPAARPRPGQPVRRRRAMRSLSSPA